MRNFAAANIKHSIQPIMKVQEKWIERLKAARPTAKGSSRGFFTSVRLVLGITLCCLCNLSLRAQNLQQHNNHPDAQYFASAEARRIGDQLILWQRVTGGWPKNVDMATPMTDSLKAAVQAEKSRRNDSTTDNGATSQQMTFLAHLYRHTH